LDKQIKTLKNETFIDLYLCPQRIGKNISVILLHFKFRAGNVSLWWREAQGLIPSTQAYKISLNF
jgi:hypothetical protein